MVPEELKSTILCPLCGGESTERIRTYQASTICEAWEQSLQMEIREEFQGLQEFEADRCLTCGFEFYKPDGIAGSPKLYERLERFSWYYMPRKWEHDIALQDLDSCENGIEIGAGRGDFVTRVQKEKRISFGGCELNLSAVAAAKRVGLELDLETAEGLAKTRAGNYDAVCSFQVLEHLTEPASFLKAAVTLLRPGGKLLLGLPNRHSFLKHQYNLLDLPPHHVSRWSDKILRKIPELFPLRLIRLAYEPLADYHVAGYVEAYTGLLSQRGFRFVRHPGIQARLCSVILATGIRKFLRGQTVYACYVRT
jgi:SAM-dependent methyltransferase